MSRRILAATVVIALALASAPHLTTARSLVPVTPTRTPERYRRAPDNTFLTYPEWFLVYSPDEYAAFVKDRPPSEFPFWGHTKQLWTGYAAMIPPTRAYDTNWGYHVMIGVIAGSTTLEYGLRSAYETLIGRIAELDGRAEEDEYGARVAQEYVDFLAQRPWYEFPFRTKLVGLWTETSLFGPNPVRKWERKYALTSEYAAKAVYGWLIGKASAGAYGAERPDTAVVLSSLPAGAESIDGLTVIERFDDGRALVTVRRYAAFKDAAIALAASGAAFEEIAGNRGPILVTALTPETFSPAAYDVLFSQPILTRPGTRRLAIAVPVDELDRAVRELSVPPMVLEHLYDY